jgi:hypothetical protein
MLSVPVGTDGINALDTPRAPVSIGDRSCQGRRRRSSPPPAHGTEARAISLIARSGLMPFTCACDGMPGPPGSDTGSLIRR